MLNTLPERIALARREVLDYADFLQIVLAGEVSQRDHGRLELRLRQAYLCGSVPRAPVQVDLSRREIELHADTKRRATDRELADALDQAADFLNDLTEFIEGRCFLYSPLPQREAPPKPAGR